MSQQYNKFFLTLRSGRVAVLLCKGRFRVEIGHCQEGEEEKEEWFTMADKRNHLNPSG